MDNYMEKTYPHLLPEIYIRRGVPIQKIDLSKDIPKLMEYVKAFDEGTAKTIETGEPTLEFGYYHDQLSEFIGFHPLFDCCLIPNKELSRVLSGLFSDKNNLRQKNNKYAW